MENFTPYSALAGGVLIGLAATLLLLFNGRIAGISGMMSGLINATRAELFWRCAFLIGIVIGAFLFNQIKPDFYHPREHFPLWLLAIGGFLVGFGTRMGNGCTSGHAVCGIARFSVRSIVATLTFMGNGFLTVYIIRHVLGVSV
ncbi:MAG: YeeE/YedE family protein [Methylococcaceae bacterium]|nr:YeeE/YedE family protein [Methylococcaceae bacterium]